MTYDEALDRAIKLLKLSKSDNPNEAALAAAKAQEIIDRYKLDASALEQDVSGHAITRPSEPVQNFADPLFDNGAKASTWKIRLASSVAQANQCRVWLNGGAVFLVGRPSDASAVRYLFAYLSHAIEGLAARDGKGNGKTWLNNYRLGAIETVSRRLREQKQATQQAVATEAFARAGESAIVLVNKAIAKVEADDRETERWMKKNLNLRAGPSRRSRSDFGARDAGRKAGHEIRLGEAKAGLGAGES